MPAPEHPEAPDLDERVARLEERLTRLEARLAIAPPAAPVAEPVAPPLALAPVFGQRPESPESFEVELEQHGFALGGIAILTVGVVFLLSLPHTWLPAGSPSLAGGMLAASLVVAVHLFPRFPVRLRGYLRGSALILLGFSALRLGFGRTPPALDLQSPWGHFALFGTSVLSIALAWSWRSPRLLGLALAVACGLALAGGTPGIVLPTLAGVTAVAVGTSRDKARPFVIPAGLLLVAASYLVWATGLLAREGGLRFGRDVAWAPSILLALLAVFGAAPLLRPPPRDEVLVNISSFATCAAGYGAYLVHTAAAFPGRFVLFHGFAALVFLALAVGFFLRNPSPVPTFVFAMTGYAALSLAILKGAASPQVFVWLAAQSLLVVATAIWFRSRFIVVANFVIFAAIVLSALLLAPRETGIGFGFGAVALVSARLLNWQQSRLALRTEAMRNTYLASAFAIFPYALYHAMPGRYITLAWIALAGGYYLLSVAFRNSKYRWMAHGTLLLATVHAIGAGIARFEPVYRVLSFLALGAALLTVSLILARSRRRLASPLTPDDRPPAAPG